jgi:hypothetical protein
MALFRLIFPVIIQAEMDSRPCDTARFDRVSETLYAIILQYSTINTYIIYIYNTIQYTTYIILVFIIISDR